MTEVRYEARSVGGKRYFVRLLPGTELIEGIKAVCEKYDVYAGAVTSILGSLKKVSYTWPTQDPENEGKYAYLDPFVLEEQVEIVSGAGSIGVMSKTGEIFVHLHAAFSDGKGIVHGGHIVDSGNPTALTVELLIEAFDDISLERVFDPETEMELFKVSRA